MQENDSYITRPTTIQRARHNNKTTISNEAAAAAGAYLRLSFAFQIL